VELIYLKLLFIDIIGGGSGRLFELFGDITVRYILFSLGILLILIKISFHKVQLLKHELIGLLLGTLFIPIGMISMANNDLSLALTDLQPLLYFFIVILILSQNINNSKLLVEIFLKYLLTISFIMGAIQVILIILVTTNIISFDAFYSYASTTSGELRFRGESGLFFYKGFFFLGLGCIYAFIKRKYLLSLFLIICLFLTQTRGLLLATMFSILLYIIISARKQVAFAIFLISPIILYITYVVTMRILFLREDVDDSDSVRFQDVSIILETNSFFYTLIGHGWGAEIGERSRIENIFMEIFFKAGFLGLLCSLFLVLYIFFQKNFQNNPYFYLLIFAFVYSQTNPFIFTPMGIVLLGVCMLSCRFSFDRKNEIISRYE
jgi:hypothetical protein